jgi:hypothetical protein
LPGLFDLWGCIFRLAFFGVRLLWVGFPFLDAWVDGGSMPGHVWGTLACFPVYGHGWHGLGFVAGLGHDFALAPVGDSFLGFASWLDRLGI